MYKVDDVQTMPSSTKSDFIEGFDEKESKEAFYGGSEEVDDCLPSKDFVKQKHEEFREIIKHVEAKQPIGNDLCEIFNCLEEISCADVKAFWNMDISGPAVVSTLSHFLEQVHEIPDAHLFCCLCSWCHSVLSTSPGVIIENIHLLIDMLFIRDWLPEISESIPAVVFIMNEMLMTDFDYFSTIFRQDDFVDAFISFLPHVLPFIENLLLRSSNPGMPYEIINGCFQVLCSVEEPLDILRIVKKTIDSFGPRIDLRAENNYYIDVASSVCLCCSDVRYSAISLTILEKLLKFHAELDYPLFAPSSEALAKLLRIPQLAEQLYPCLFLIFRFGIYPDLIPTAYFHIIKHYDDLPVEAKRSAIDCIMEVHASIKLEDYCAWISQPMALQGVRYLMDFTADIEQLPFMSNDVLARFDKAFEEDCFDDELTDQYPEFREAIVDYMVEVIETATPNS